MSNEVRAAVMGQQEIVSLLVSHQELTSRYDALSRKYDELQQQLDWLTRQLFGAKSERHVPSGHNLQLTLGEMPAATAEAVPSIVVPAHQRRRTSAADRDEGELRFDDTVPVQRIVLAADIPADQMDDYQQIGQKITRKLAQRPGSYVVLEYVRPVFKKHEAGDAIASEIMCAAPPPAVLDRSFADVSLFAGLLMDKFLYHLPLYRQHQRMAACGVKIGRGTLTNWVHRCAELLTPIHQAQLASILESSVLAMDETPLKAGRKKDRPPGRGQMATGYFWPVYGDKDEVCFHFAPTRAHAVVPALLAGFRGTLVSDGYDAYDRYAAKSATVRHAACWVHARRGFDKALATDKAAATDALDRIGQLYDVERELGRGTSAPEKVLAQRALLSKPVVEDFFEWLRSLQAERALLPTSPLAKAVAYALARESALKVFLEDPAVPLDTNHLERQIRPVAIGRRNWLFCWTEVGAHYSGVIQGLLSTCRLQGVDPYTYLVDVLQRVQTHPAASVQELTPRVWKGLFAADPLRSDLESVAGQEAPASWVGSGAG
jgi:transposase